MIMKYLFSIVFCLLLFSCKKENIQPVTSDIHYIKSPDQAIADSLKIPLQEYLTIKAAMAALTAEFTSQNSHTTNNTTSSTSGF